jgi:hypothetical protein
MIIKSEIEQVFGRRIVSSRDCNQLCEEIFQKTQFQLNPHTLRRFFGLVKANYPASVSTLSILSNYCGYSSLEEVTAPESPGSADPELIRQQSVLNYLASLFTDVPVNDAHNQTFLSLVRHTIGFLSTNPGLIDKFHSIIAKSFNGQKYYFEHYPNIDKLNSFYGDGLRYYLNEKRNSEASVLTHSLYVFRHWLNRDDLLVKKHFAHIGEGESDQIAWVTSGRSLAARLYYGEVAGIHPGSTILEIYNTWTSLNFSRAKNPGFLSFELVVGEALILTGNHEEGLFYINQVAGRNEEPETDNEALRQQAYVFQAIALLKLEKLAEAEKKYDSIKPYAFHFLSKKYLNSLFLAVGIRIKKKIARQEEQLDALINELGYQRLKDII